MRISLDERAFLPIRAHDTDAGLDLRSPVDVTVPANGSVVIDTGVHIELPFGTTGFIKSKSGLNVNYGIVSEGVIDEGYTGSIKVKLYNHGKYAYDIMTGDRISQLVILNYCAPELELVRLEEFANTERGNNGFGSTGR